METSINLKNVVKQKYSEIASRSHSENSSSCCGSTCCSSDTTNIMSDDYSEIDGYHADADLGLGCGLPTKFAQIKKGDVVIDLGSGAGNDVFIARNETGENGKVIGIDFTPAMIEKARSNAEKLNFHNVEFKLGDIEHIPVSDNTADVVVSNCVLNLVPDKEKVFSEIYRVLKPNGHFSISDIVIEGDLPPAIKNAAEMYAGCVSGAIQKNEYLNFIRNANFVNVTLQKEKPIVIPDDILSNYLSQDELATFKTSGNNIISITVYGEKAGNIKSCCAPECCN